MSTSRSAYVWRRAPFAVALVFCLALSGSRSLEAQSALATLNLTAGWATFGVPLPQGAATDLRVGQLATQVDVKTRYSDGSIRFAVVTAKVPASGTYSLVAGSSSQGAAIAPTWPGASVQMKVWPSGTTYTATLPVFDGTDSWLSGPLVREARVRVTPWAGGVSHPFLRVLFDIRSYNDGSHRVDMIGENTLVQNATTDRIDYDLAIQLNGATVYSRSTVTGSGTLTSTNQTLVTTTQPHGLSKGEMVELTSGPQSGESRMVSTSYNDTTFFVSWPWSVAQTSVAWRRVAVRHWAGSRWRKTFPVGLTESQVTPDTHLLTASHAVPDYLTTLPTDASYVGRGPNPYEPMNIGVVEVPGNQAGGRPEIGPYPQWTARYIAHPTPELKAVVLGEGSSAGSFPIHWSDSDTKPLIALTDHPTFWRSWGNGGKGMGLNDDKTVDHFQVDTAHIGSLAAVPYLLTGDRYFLDEMRFWANWSIISTYTQGSPASYASRGDAAGYLGQIFNAARGWGWGLRNLTDVAVWAPDNDPYKAYFTTLLTNNLRTADSYAASRTDSPWDGFVDSLDGFSPNWPESGDTYPKYNVVSLWQVCYLGWAVDHAMALGWTDGSVIRRKIVNLVMNIYNSPGVAPGERAPYRLFIGYLTTPQGPKVFYPSVAAAYAQMRLDPSASNLMPSSLGDYYGTDVRMIYQIGQRIGDPSAAAALKWIEGYTDPLGNRFADRVNDRSQYGLADAPGQALGGGTSPAAPTGLRIIR